jgi:hypothetical protein
VHHVTLSDGNDVGMIEQKLKHHQLVIEQIQPTIEDCFMELMTKET